MTVPDQYIRTYYASLVVDLPPLVGQAAFDACTDAAAIVITDPPIGRVRLALRPCPVPPSATRYQYRSRPGTVVTGIHRWPADLELLPWSATHIELGLRPRSRPFNPFPPTSVVTAGHALLSGLAAGMHAWADQPLAQWTAQMPADAPIDG